MKQDPNAAGSLKEKVRQIKVKTTFVCNDDFFYPAGGSVGDSATQNRREQETEYILIYKGNGNIWFDGVLAGRKQDWQSMKLKHGVDCQNTPYNVYAPSSLYRLDAAYQFWQQGNAGDNTEVTFERLNLLNLQRNVW